MSQSKPRIQKSASAYRSIGEVGKELGLETHVLRYWETKFPKQVRPIKRNDGRRMFRADDIAGLRAIQILVHERGLTLKGAKSLLNAQGVDAVLQGDARLVGDDVAPVAESTVRELQETVRNAFETADTPAESDALAADPLQNVIEGSRQSSARLRNVLKDMESLRQRLETHRDRSAA